MKLQIEKSTSSYGRYVVRVSEIDLRFFWRLKDAKAFVRLAGVQA